MFVYDFIKMIGKIEVKYLKKFRKPYLTIKEKFSCEHKYNQVLDEYLREFRKEMQSLPFKLNTKQSRKAFIYNLHDEFLFTKELLDKQFQQIISRSHDCISKQKVRFKYCFPRYFRRKYLIKARKEYQKLYIAFQLRIDKIENAIDVLKLVASNDGIDVDTSSCYCFEKFKISLSSPELSYLSFKIMQKVTEEPDFNRSHLSRLLADNFSTKRTSSPRASQIRKHFTEVNDTVKLRIESLFDELSRDNSS